MQNSLSVIKDEPHQLEFDFEGYDTELLPEDSFAMAETITLNAITGASTFTDLFEDIFPNVIKVQTRKFN